LQVFGEWFEATKLKPYWVFGEALAQKNAPKDAARLPRLPAQTGMSF
jgi:hypothetical protein